MSSAEASAAVTASVNTIFSIISLVVSPRGLPSSVLPLNTLSKSPRRVARDALGPPLCDTRDVRTHYPGTRATLGLPSSVLPLNTLGSKSPRRVRLARAHTRGDSKPSRFATPCPLFDLYRTRFPYPNRSRGDHTRRLGPRSPRASRFNASSRHAHTV